jgi:hypothetical protein
VIRGGTPEFPKEGSYNDDLIKGTHLAMEADCLCSKFPAHDPRFKIARCSGNRGKTALPWVRGEEMIRRGDDQLATVSWCYLTSGAVRMLSVSGN